MSKGQLNLGSLPLNSSNESCDICFEELKTQEIGIPEHCDHAFCFSCLTLWAKQHNSCPLDRQLFQYIFKKKLFSDRKPYAKVNITNAETEIYLEDYYIYCHACGDDDQEYPLFTCARCNNGYHSMCLNSFDTSTWMCPACNYKNGEDTGSDIESMKTSKIHKLPRKRIITFPFHDKRRTVSCRRLQQSTSQNVTRRIVNPLVRSIPSSGATNHIPKTIGSKSSIRSVITPTEAARRIATSGIPIQDSLRSIALRRQAQNMAALKRKRKQFLCLPPRIPIHQLPRIQRLADAPPRPPPKVTTQKSTPVATSFIDKLLHSQEHLHALNNVQMHG